MKKQQYILRHAAGMDWIIEINQQEAEYVTPLSVNECGAMIWRGLEAGLGNDDLSIILQNQYGIDSKEALKAVAMFMEQLTNRGLKINQEEN